MIMHRQNNSNSPVSIPVTSVKSIILQLHTGTLHSDWPRRAAKELTLHRTGRTACASADQHSLNYMVEAAENPSTTRGRVAPPHQTSSQGPTAPGYASCCSPETVANGATPSPLPWPTAYIDSESGWILNLTYYHLP